jgi:hypothetical protein
MVEKESSPRLANVPREGRWTGSTFAPGKLRGSFPSGPSARGLVEEGGQAGREFRRWHEGRSAWETSCSPW